MSDTFDEDESGLLNCLLYDPKLGAVDQSGKLKYKTLADWAADMEMREPWVATDPGVKDDDLTVGGMSWEQMRAVAKR